MSKQIKFLMFSAAALAMSAQLQVRAEDLKPVTCSVAVDYLLNNVVRSSYRKDFAVDPGVPFSDDFSTFTRFGFLDASSRLDADKSTVVTISFFRDVGVFDAVDFTTEVRIRDNKDDGTTSASHTYYHSQTGSHTTNYALGCNRVK